MTETRNTRPVASEPQQARSRRRRENEKVVKVEDDWVSGAWRKQGRVHGFDDAVPVELDIRAMFGGS